MRRTVRGGTLGKYLLLLVLIGLLVALFMFKNNYGAIGQVDKLDLASTKDYIAYIRESGGKSDLYIIRADGSGKRRLTADGKGKRSPNWSPDGKELCYAAEVSEDRTPAYQIFILGNGDPRQATYGSTSKDRPQYSPDGRWIAYLSGGCIKIVQPNGKNGRQVFPPPAHVGAPGDDSEGDTAKQNDASDAQRKPPIRQFVWAPNSLGVAGVQEVEGEYAVPLGNPNWWQKDQVREPVQTVNDPELAVVLPSIEGRTTMELLSGDLMSCCWMPDSRAVLMAVRKEREGLSGIVRQGVDVKGMQPEPVILAMKGSGLLFDHPQVSPDGGQVAFVVMKVAGIDRTPLGIAVAPIGSGAPLVLKTPADLAKLKIVCKGDARSPRWSADGKRLLYLLSGAGGKTDVWVCMADGSGALNLTKGDGDCSDAVWSPATR